MEVPGLDAYEDMAVRCLIGEYIIQSNWMMLMRQIRGLGLWWSTGYMLFQ